ncbi:RidA family protein [Bacillus sp. TL12]|uniref:RidA family protein n=1 Tax=Bacillus sp. TL12 TaxID=2894756 RepID=UPI001F517958|nr:RidA family protein [Bacillus sp. TL12]MCI0768266.1 RidA family protein [Bacillus sp. TL12]
MKRINPKTLTDTNHVISQIVVTSRSSLAFIFGQVALNDKGELIGSGNYGLQALHTNPKLALEAVGAELEHVAQMKIHVVDHRPELVDIIFNAGFEVFGLTWPLTASTFSGVQSLAFPDGSLELMPLLHCHNWHLKYYRGSGFEWILKSSLSAEDQLA